jgi:hypothetical protein
VAGEAAVIFDVLASAIPASLIGSVARLVPTKATMPLRQEWTENGHAVQLSTSLNLQTAVVERSHSSITSTQARTVAGCWTPRQ